MSISPVPKLQHILDKIAGAKVVCIALLLALPVSMHGQEQGVHMVLVNGYSLMNVSVDSLQDDTVFITAGGKSLGEPVDSIVSVTSVRPGGGFKALAIGTFAGAGLGFIVGEIIDRKNENAGLMFPPDEGTKYKVFLPIMGGVAGGLIAAAATPSSRLSREDFAFKTREQKRAILITLVNKR